MNRAFTRFLTALVAVLPAVVVSGSGAGFHPDGGGTCGCHNMHESENGFAVQTGPRLIRQSSATELCLSCHATQNGAVLSPIPTAPSAEIGAGNFTFLLEDNINDAVSGLSNPILGSHAGHSVIAAAYGLDEDFYHPTAPGGSYPASEMGCTSCHDPHGGGNYRMLWGAGPTESGRHTFTNPAPIADGIALAGSESANSHTAYQGNWSRWCANCHGLYHSNGKGSFQHPVDQSLSGTQIDSYNKYRGEADPNGGDVTSAYLPQVPYEDPGMTTTSTSGPIGSGRITCLTCHRAHATSAPSSMRWDTNVLYINDDGQVSGSYPLPNPYPGPNQRSLCIKCHSDYARTHGTTQPCLECHG